jgi:hypothetical protein
LTGAPEIKSKLNVTNIEENDKRKDEIIFELVRKEYESQLQRRKDMDSKAGSLIGYVTVVTGIIIGLGTFSILEKLSKPEYYIPYFAGISLLLSSIVISLIATRVTSWGIAPDVKKIEEAMKEHVFTYRSIIRRVAIDMVDAVINNHEQNQNKARWIVRSWYCLIAGLILIVIYAAIFTISGNVKETETTITIEGNATTIKQIVSELSQAIVSDKATDMKVWYFYKSGICSKFS